MSGDCGIDESSSGRALRQRSVASKKLGSNTIVHQTVFFFPLDIVNPGKLCESPLPAHDDLLATREFELGTAKRLLGVNAVLVLATHGQEHLSNGNTSAHSLWLAESAPHTRLEPISSGARKHLVDTEHVEGVHTDTQMERILSGVLGHILVASNTSRLKRLTGDVLLLPRYQVHAEGEFVHPFLLHAHIVDTDLRVRHTPAESRLGVRLVLDLPVTSRRTATHGDGSAWLRSRSLKLKEIGRAHV